ncbi:SH3 domain-containing protein [Jannaschia sp. M317]|uniref:SH3 domain-containing protein n=1 Tax=Jannaschia sp. M317 TaxID=2867011 RepID=UPI0021A2841E|nr:SH3 domain-containing protein [Jannaschia sp. M317]UWQ17822.1 SH3 domain-containing protein [Jannaschia sp. M317]
MRAFLVALSAVLLTAQLSAEPVMNPTDSAIPLQDAPGPGRLIVGRLLPGEVADLGVCDALGRWCQVTAAGVTGWVDADVVPLMRISGDSLDPVSTPNVTVSPLPDDGAARALPQSVLEAVARASGGEAARDWQPPLLLSVTEPMGNVTDGIVNLRAGPGTDTEVVDQLQPGAGGVIDLCSVDETWCRIRRGGAGPDGWIKATFLGLQRL